MKTQTLLALAITVKPALAVFPLTDLATDSLGNVIGGSYSGDGTVQSNVVAPAGGATGSFLFVDDASSGTVTVDSLPTPSQTRLSPGTGVDFSFTFGGGTGDVFLNDRNSFDGGANDFDGISLSGMSGVTSASVTIEYSNLHAARNFNLTGRSGPYFAGVILADPGEGLNAFDYNLVAELNGVVSSTDGVNFSPGLDPSFTMIGSPEYDPASPGDTVFTADSLPDIPTGFLSIKGFDTNEDGNLSLGDLQNVYAESLTWTITRDDGLAFPEGTRFLFSLDGQVYSNQEDATAAAAAIPEVSGFFALSTLFMLSIFSRRRQH